MMFILLVVWWHHLEVCCIYSVPEESTASVSRMEESSTLETEAADMHERLAYCPLAHNAIE